MTVTPQQELRRGDLVATARRLLRHLEQGTTDQAPTTYAVPVANYLDPARFALEMDQVFRRVPIALALSCELRQPGAYRAESVAGVPVLVTRTASGEARAFLNVCRHRGSELIESGCGQAGRFSCPYHGWTYGNDGRLLAVTDGRTFGSVDKDGLGLTPLPVAERAGFVFGVLTPGAPLDIDAWLGGYRAELEALELGEWHVFSRWELPGPNWKVAKDGYLEGYHFGTLHETTVGAYVHSNVMVADTYGPHQRLVFPGKTISDLAGQPEETWRPRPHLSPVHALFPNTAIAAAWGPRAMVSQLFPGPTAGESRTVQTVITRRPPDSADAQAAARAESDFYFNVVRDEDYKTAFGVARGLASRANEEFVFGRNELALHHFHRSLDSLLAGGSPS